MATILALDLSTTTGWAYGPAGKVECVDSGSWRLKKGSDEKTRASRNLARFLRDLFEERGAPDFAAIEAAYSAAQMMHMGNAAHTADLTHQLVGAAHAVLACYGVRTEACEVADVRGHFTGRKKWGDRDEAKRKTVERCHMLKYFPDTEWDDNRADACAVHDYASAVFFKSGQLKLVGTT